MTNKKLKSKYAEYCKRTIDMLVDDIDKFIKGEGTEFDITYRIPQSVHGGIVSEIFSNRKSFFNVCEKRKYNTVCQIYSTEKEGVYLKERPSTYGGYSPDFALIRKENLEGEIRLYLGQEERYEIQGNELVKEVRIKYQREKAEEEKKEKERIEIEARKKVAIKIKEEEAYKQAISKAEKEISEAENKLGELRKNITNPSN